MAVVGIVFGILVGLVILGLEVRTVVHILKQAGYPPERAWLLLLGQVPVLGALFIFAMFFVLAFQEWPVRGELRVLRSWAYEQYQRNAGTPPPMAGPDSVAQGSVAQGYGRPGWHAQQGGLHRLPYDYPYGGSPHGGYPYGG